MSGVKRQKLEHEPVSYSETSKDFPGTFRRHLLDISDDVLLNVLSYLPGSDLYNLTRTCKRFDVLCRDRTLWGVADFRSCRMSAGELCCILQLLHPHTKFLAIRGFTDVASREEAGILPKRFLACLPSSCPHLETFIVEDFYIDVDKVDCRDFPGTVKCLSLKGCQVVDSAKVRCLSTEKSHFFLQMYVHFPNLEKLVLSYCRWFRIHSLMAISKCANLVELRLDGIRHLHDNVPYLSLATSFGFRKLKILDLRNTTVGSSAMRGFNNLPNLTHLYLECPLQYRQKDTSDPAPSTSQHCPESSDEDCEEVNLMRGHENSCVIVLRFGGSPEVWHEDGCASNCCGNGEQSRIIHVRQNLNESEGTSRQEDCACSNETGTSQKKDEHSGTRNEDGTTHASTNNLKISIDVGNVNKKNNKSIENNEEPDDSAICVSKASKSSQLGTNSQSLKVEEVDAEAGSSSANTCARTSSQIVDISDAVAEKSSSSEKRYSSCCAEEHVKNSTHENELDNEGSGADGTMDKSIKESAQHVVKRRRVCRGTCIEVCSESSDDNSSDDEANNKEKSKHKHKNKDCSCMHRPVDWFTSGRNEKCAKTSCLGGRHEELIDDLSIDYFLSRDMWRVTLDGNIVRCNDKSPQLHTLVIRFYPHVTNKTLTLLLRMSSLRHVDVTGTKVTEEGVLWFRMLRPDVTVESDFGPPYGVTAKV